jgi:hypothetical protein
MAKYLGIGDGENVVYADNSNVWQSGKNVDEVIRKLTEKAALFVDYTRSMGLSMNASKTQMLLLANGGNVANITVMVDRNSINLSNTIELLGVRYDRKLSTAPHVRSLLAAVRQQASVAARLANHLPRGQYLRQLAYKRVMGKFSHALAAVARPRLSNEENASSTWSKIQVAVNNVARSITGVRLRDHVRIPDLLDRAGIPSANRMVVKVVSMEAWMCKSSSDGKDGVRNYVGAILFDDNKTDTGKMTRLAKTGKISVPLRGGDTFVAHAANVWNKSDMLCRAFTKLSAKRAALNLASLSPL